jgi:hypothetical protein
MSETIIRAETLERLFLREIKTRPGYKQSDLAIYKTLKPDWNEIYGDDLKYWADLAIKTYNLKVQHGDILWWLQGRGYRNDNLLFWHEDQGVVFPYTKIDDYGSVPPCFRVGSEFLPEFWFPAEEYMAKVDHNTLVFLEESLVQEIKENLKEVKKTKKWTCKVKIQGKTYAVSVDNKDQLKEFFTYQDGCFYQEW